MAEGLAHNSYFLATCDRAAVIYPRRDCSVYLNIAQREGVQIDYIFETHRNEDYVIGSLELQQLTGAEIFHAPGLEWKYGKTLEKQQTFSLGDLYLNCSLNAWTHQRESVLCVN